MVEVDCKLAKVEDTDIVMSQVTEMIKKTKKQLEQHIKAENEKIDERIKLIYSEELSYPGLFGNLVNNEPNKFPRLKDFTVDTQQVNDWQTKDLKTTQYSLEKALKSIRLMNGNIDKEIQPMLKLLREGRDKLDRDVRNISKCIDDTDEKFEAHIEHLTGKLGEMDQRMDTAKIDGLKEELEIQIDRFEQFREEKDKEVKQLDAREVKDISELEYKIKQKIKKLDSEFERKRCAQEQNVKNLQTKSAELERRVEE